MDLLTPAQLEKLRMLDEEMEKKQEFDKLNKERRMKSSQKTGIPENLVDSDVVKVATLLGLVKSLDVLEGRRVEENKFSLLNFFLNDEESVSFDYSKIPAYFVLSPNRISEQEKSRAHQKFVEQECNSFCSFVNSLIEKETNEISRVLYFPKRIVSISSFVTTVETMISDVLEMLSDDSQDDETWEQLGILRNSLLCFIHICEFKTMIVKHISILKTLESGSRLLKNLSFFEANLSLYPGFKEIKSTSPEKIQQELIVRNHMKNPELVAFDMDSISKECCVPSLMFVDLLQVLKYGVIGPYRNNPICFARFTNQSFYVLKHIQNGIRVWILDEALTTFSEKLRELLLEYCIKLYNTFCKEYFDEMPKNESEIKSSEIAMRIFQTIKLLCCPERFRDELRRIVAVGSELTPTELDVFNEIPSRDHCIELAKFVGFPTNLFLG